MKRELYYESFIMKDGSTMKREVLLMKRKFYRPIVSREFDYEKEALLLKGHSIRKREFD